VSGLRYDPDDHPLYGLTRQGTEMIGLAISGLRINGLCLYAQVGAVTGPRYDSPHCSVLPDCPPTVEKKLTNNFNKALVLDYSDSRFVPVPPLKHMFFSVWPSETEFIKKKSFLDHRSKP
jgi:hypothetical protein